MGESICCDDFVKRCQDELGATAVILFGSRATGDYLFDSDIDICVIAQRFSKMTRKERIDACLRLWDGPVALEPIALTPDELLAADRPLVWEILATGVPLVEDTAWFQGREKLAELIERNTLLRVPGGWDVRSAKG